MSGSADAPAADAPRRAKLGVTCARRLGCPRKACTAAAPGEGNGSSLRSGGQHSARCEQQQRARARVTGGNDLSDFLLHHGLLGQLKLEPPEGLTPPSPLVFVRHDGAPRRRAALRHRRA